MQHKNIKNKTSKNIGIKTRGQVLETTLARPHNLKN